MIRLLIILLLFTGFVSLVPSVPRKYYLIEQGKSWSDALAYCKAGYTDMAVIRDNEDLIRLQNEIQTKQFSFSAWIGLSVDVNSWHWSMGNEPLGSFRPFDVGQPNNFIGQEECGVTAPWPWRDMDCTTLYPSVCFDDRYTGNERYIYIPDGKTWSEAQAYCRQFHTDLVTVSDSTENTFIMGLTSGWTWFGLFRNSWKWTDQTNFSTLSWMTGQPDNYWENEECGYLNNGLVADAACLDIMPFFCYKNVTEQQQIVKVKVQSSEDVNDPAMKAAILDQINQKLMEMGMTGTFTLKWRKQSDGEVFYKEKIEEKTLQ